jgi:hypothetical protein
VVSFLFRVIPGLVPYVLLVEGFKQFGHANYFEVLFGPFPEDINMPGKFIASGGIGKFDNTFPEQALVIAGFPLKFVVKQGPAVHFLYGVGQGRADAEWFLVQHYPVVCEVGRLYVFADEEDTIFCCPVFPNVVADDLQVRRLFLIARNNENDEEQYW